MTMPEDARVDGLLREAVTTAAWPSTPDLRATVAGRLAREGLVPDLVVEGPSFRGRPPVSRLVRPLAFALVALLILAGVATALGYRLPGLDILFVDRLPPAGSGLDLGSPVPLADAVGLDRPRVLVPSSLPAPDTAFELGAGVRRIVTLAYRATAGQATLTGSDLALTVMAVPGEADVDLIRKLLGTGTTLEAVDVGGSRGWWISGAPHDILVRRPDGSAGVLTSVLSGDTLLFVREGTLYRLESALGREATISIAESMR